MNQLLAFEPFGTLDGVLRGEPIKIMPVGTFYRGKRKIEITSEDLKQIETNTKAGLPRFRIPINENHGGVGKIGTVYDVAFDPAGADGPGLYATRYELTEVGKQYVSEKRFDAVSPEMVWSKNDAKYQDPQTGTQHDNVLVGLALTERPFFGHDNVALFSDKPEVESMADKKGKMQRLKDMMAQIMKTKDAKKSQDMMAQAMQIIDEPDDDEGEPGGVVEKNAYGEPLDLFKDYDAETRREFAKKGWAMPDGSYPIADGGDLQNAIHALGRGGNNPHSAIKAHIVKRAKALGLADKLPPDWEGSTKETAGGNPTKEAQMSDTPQQDAFTVNAEEFAALKAKADKVDELTKQAEKFTAQLNSANELLNKTRRERDLDRMVQHAENFTAIPGKAEDIGEKLLQLQEKDPELFKWVDGLLQTLDKQLTQSELFSQHVVDRQAEGADTLEAYAEKLLTEKFNNDRSKYVEALKMAETQRPDLAKAYYQGG